MAIIAGRLQDKKTGTGLAQVLMKDSYGNLWYTDLFGEFWVLNAYKDYRITFLISDTFQPFYEITDDDLTRGYFVFGIDLPAQVTMPPPVVPPPKQPKAVVDHFYTTNSIERQAVLNSGGIDEGIAGYVFSNLVPGAVPFYRMILPSSSHFYTVNALEKQTVLNKGGVDEAIACFVFPSQTSSEQLPLYRAINPRPPGTPNSVGNHIYSMSAIEIQQVKNIGGVDEGIACYILQNSDPNNASLVPLYRIRRKP